jgi:uncharacterized OB-fold protein
MSVPIIPDPGPLTRPYWEQARAGRLVLQHCHGCGHTWHPPLPRCPRCHAADTGWQQASGEGTVYSYTVVHHATHAALADRVPYVIAIVELAEGPRVVTGIRGAAPDQVWVGMPVRAVFEEVTPEVTLPQFAPR